jgi:UDP-N-acetylglucosamine--N-acetylmuramyl-(pentapeptide) pyrophosphoryl-undecaprenol N-acetylglucosamine transferase
MRLLICAGGTGGGVYPALAVLQAAPDQIEKTLWVGGKGGMEASLIARTSHPYAEISAAGVHGVGIRSLPANVIKLAKGFFESRRILRQFKPDVLFFTGGYLAVPMALAGVKIPSLLYVPDIEPGLALKTLARFADCIALTSEVSTRFFNPRKKLEVTGYPTRPELKTLPKEAALSTFGFSTSLPVLLIIGGSKGAQTLNKVVFDHLSDLLDFTQILHLTGSLDIETAQALKTQLPAVLAERYQPYSYLHEEISSAFSCADLALSRAGASTLGELPLFGLPAILVPYPFAWRYQKVNADYLAAQNAALVIENDRLTDKLVTTVKELFVNREQLTNMQKNMKSLAHPQAASQIADLLVALGKQKEGMK